MLVEKLLHYVYCSNESNSGWMHSFILEQPVPKFQAVVIARHPLSYWFWMMMMMGLGLSFLLLEVIYIVGCVGQITSSSQFDDRYCRLVTWGHWAGVVVDWCLASFPEDGVFGQKTKNKWENLPYQSQLIVNRSTENLQNPNLLWYRRNSHSFGLSKRIRKLEYRWATNQ
jgi:hypothetical protein